MSNNQWFGSQNWNICFMQDIIHIGTKLRNRLLKPSVSLIIGEKIATVSHLKMLLNTRSKDDHGLTYTLICPDDRQNYDSLKRIMEPNVREALSNYVIGSEATSEYIRICDEITSSLYHEDVSPLERLSRIWRSTYFLRAWRLFLKSENATRENYKINDNFITRNAYACIELNAQNLVILIRKFRDEKKSEFFIPSLFNSQPCEETFRKMRSMGTINFTKINFTLLELMHLVGRVEILNDIVYFKLADCDIKFPRNRLTNSHSKVFDLPSDFEIKDCLHKALSIARSDAHKFGIAVTHDQIIDSELRDFQVIFSDASLNSAQDHTDLMIGRDNDGNEGSLSCHSLRDYSDKNVYPKETNRFVEVALKSGKKLVRKSSLIGLLSDSNDKLSSDRLKRTQNGSSKRYARRTLEFVNISANNSVLSKANELHIGNWCLFYDDSSNDICKLGNILSFRYVNGRTEKDKFYSLDFAPTHNNNSSRGVEVLSSWYQVNASGQIKSDDTIKHAFININQYIATLSTNAIHSNHEKRVLLLDKYSVQFENELRTLLHSKT